MESGLHTDNKRTTHFHTHPEQRLSMKLLKFIDVLYTRIWHDLSVLSPPRLPKTGPAILICNHISSIDPLMIQSVLKRVVVWMMAKEYYEIKFMKPAFDALQVIPVDRGARDTSAMRLALRALQEGRILGVFPEGRIETEHALLPFQPGVAQMAIKTKVPVFPCYLDGTQRGQDMIRAATRRNVASIRFGPEVHFDRAATTPEALQAATELLKASVESLRLQTPRSKFR